MAPTNQGNSSFSVISFCLFILYNWILNASWIARQLIFRRILVFVVVQLLSLFWLFVTPWTAARQASLSVTISGSWLKLMSVEWVKPSNHLILWCPHLFLSSILSSIMVFSSESTLSSGGQKFGTSVLPGNIQGWFHKNFHFNTCKLLVHLHYKKNHQKNQPTV